MNPRTWVNIDKILIIQEYDLKPDANGSILMHTNFYKQYLR